MLHSPLILLLALKAVPSFEHLLFSGVTRMGLKCGSRGAEAVLSP